MKRSKIIRLHALLLCAALLGSLTTGCGVKPTGTAVPQQETERPAVEQKEDNPSPRQRNADGVDKEETVYVQAAPDGTVQKVSVEARLSNPGDGQPIPDRSNLTDIRSTKGDEDYTRNGEELLWDNHGEDVEYKGTSTQALPVSVRVSYTLNGKPISPQSLAGKSGRVTIRFDYENHTQQSVTVTRSTGEKKSKNTTKTKGKEKKAVQREVTVPVPFVALSTLFLSEDNFSNVEVTNGQVVRTDGQSVVVGYACPGLADGLRLADYEPTEDIDVPEYVEVTADVTDFSLDFTATVLTPELLNELEQKNLDDVDELTEGMRELMDASKELAEGTKELSDGLSKFKSYLGKYTKGVRSAASGAKALQDGLEQLNTQTLQLQQQAEELQTELETQLEQQGEDPEQLLKQIENLSQVFEEARKELTELSEFAQGVQQYQATVEQSKDDAQTALSRIDWAELERNSGAEAAQQAAAQVEECAEELNLTEEQQAQLTQRLSAGIDLSDSTKEAQQAVNDAQTALEAIPQSPDLTQGAERLQNSVETLLQQLEQLKPYVETLPALSELLEQMETGLNGYVQGVEQLSQGSSQLSEGLKQLNKAGKALNKGFDGAAKGAKELAEGFAEFDEDGIQELGHLAGEELQELADRLRGLQKAGSGYQSFGGLRDGQTGSVRFVVETESVG